MEFFLFEIIYGIKLNQYQVMLRYVKPIKSVTELIKHDTDTLKGIL